MPLKTIIVPLDAGASADALAPAFRVAEATGASVVVASADDSLADVAAPETVVVTVVAAERNDLVALAEAAPDPLIVMKTRAGSGAEERLFSTADEMVVRRAPCPVMLIGPRCATPDALAGRRSLVVCTDGSTYSKATIPAATSVAKALGLRLRVLQVSPSGILASPFGRPRDVASAERFADAIRAGGLDVECRTIRDPDPAAAIVEAALDDPPACIVLATHGRTGLAGAVLGSVAEDVIRAAACPVIVVRPRFDHLEVDVRDVARDGETASVRRGAFAE